MATNSELASLFHNAYPQAELKNGEHFITCHLHDDQHPSLRVNVDKGTWYCDPCGKGGHVSQLPKMPKVYSKPQRTKPLFYEYQYPDGKPAFRLVRNPSTKSQFFQRYVSGAWEKSDTATQGPLPLLLYRLPEVLTSDLVYIVEGEKDAESLRKLGLVATTNCGGAKNWKPEHNAYLKGKQVVILGDNDVPGKSRLFNVGYSLRDIASSVSCISPKYFGGVKDVSDFLAADPSNEGVLLALLEFPDPFPWDTTEEWVREMNQTYATSMLGSKFVIIRETNNPYTDLPEIDFLLPTDFERFEIENGKRWLRHPMRRSYQKVIFGPLESGPHYYNLWRGFAFTPEENPALIARFWEHVHQNIANNNESLFLWIKSWCARMVQEPWKPAETVLALRGGQGTGKSIFATALGKLFGPHFFHASSTGQFIGRFNAHLKDKVLVFGDEGFWAGDKPSESALKRLVTESVLAIEPKGKDILTVPNFIHLIMATNEEWFVPAGSWERRFACFDVLPAQQGNRDYFGRMVTDLESGGYAALLHDLLCFDYAGLGIDPCVIPNTEALQTQKELSAPNEIKFMLDVCEEGSYLPDWEDEASIPFGPFYEAYLQACRGYPGKRRITKKAFGMLLTRLFGAAQQGRYMYQNRSHNSKVYTVGSFDIFRQKVTQLLEQ